MKKIITAIAVMLMMALFVVGASAKTVKKGDVNLDDKVNAIDARIVLRAGAQIDEITSEQALIGDMDKNGKITAIDARAILRIGSMLDKNDETVEIGEESDDDTDVERTEISDGFGMSTDDFIKKYGGMRKLDTTDGTVQYANDYVTVVHNPKMIYTGCINSISITGGKYTLCGVYAGMSSSQAAKTLKDDNWKISSQTEAQVILEQNAMRIKLVIADGKVASAEYYLGFSLVGNEDPTTKPTESTTKEDPTTRPPETTTQAPETTTKAPETTTQVPETTTKAPETTTQPPETTTQPPETTTEGKYPQGNDDFNSLPDQIKAYLIGEFAFEGFRYEKDAKTPVSMTFSNGNVKAEMSDSMNDGSLVKIEMIVDNSGKKAKLYLVNSSNGLYCDMSTLTIMFPEFNSVNTSDLDYSSVDINNISVEITGKTIGGQAYVVYNVKTKTDRCEFYTINGEIKKMINYDSVGNIKSQIDVATFRTDVDPSETSISSYKKTLNVSKVLGISILG